LISYTLENHCGLIPHSSPAKPGLINVLIEITAGSKNKYEYDKDLQAFALDQVLYSSVQYPTTMVLYPTPWLMMAIH